MLEHVAGDGDVSTLGVELDLLSAPGAFEASLRGGRAPDVQASPGRGDLDVGPRVVREQRPRGVVGDAMLVQAAVEVDTADAIPQDEAERRAGGARGLEAAPRGGMVTEAHAPVHMGRLLTWVTQRGRLVSSAGRLLAASAWGARWWATRQRVEQKRESALAQALSVWPQCSHVLTSLIVTLNSLIFC